MNADINCQLIIRTRNGLWRVLARAKMDSGEYSPEQNGLWRLLPRGNFCSGEQMFYYHLLLFIIPHLLPRPDVEFHI